jgi:hypothetical protein
MVEVWIFTWQLVMGGAQFSQPYATSWDCAAARLEIMDSGKSPEGRPVESSKPCVRIQ